MKVLVTGSSSGFGKLIVETLLKNGHAVAASMRDAGGRNKAHADALAKLGAKTVELDVASCKSVDAGVKNAVAALGGLDAVVNNAGIGVLGIQETFTVEDFRKLFEVNLFGVQRVNRAALPHLREQGEGVLLHVSSLLGRMTIPFYGPYNASKWALEALAENYRIELSGFGIDSVIVEPGGYPTDFHGRMLQPSDRERVESYGEFAKVPEQSFKAFQSALAQNKEQKSQDVADAVLKVLETPAGKRPFRTVVDKMGMGTIIEPYNQAAEKVTRGIFQAFGMDDALKLKVKEKAAA